MDNKKIIETIKECINESPYHVASTVKLDIEELKSKIYDDEELKKEWNRYLTRYKNFLLIYSMDKKAKDVYIALLEQAGVLKSGGNNSDLEIDFVIEEKKDQDED